MTVSQSNNKRLAKNTALLYVRTFFVMAISLFTSRIVLQTLGVDDYGTYNIVGGFVSFFSIISGTLVATTQRYITFELGKGDHANIQKVFSAAMGIHIALAVLLLILFETIGLWFLNNRLNIPIERLSAANWVFQFSIIAFLITIISTPYTAVIIAHEKMKAFAYMSILDVSLKLLAVYALFLTSYDKLIMYSLFLFTIAFVDRMVYNLYCKKHFPETKFKLVKDIRFYKSMFSFASMNFIGSFASILSQQGTDIIINIFFGVTLNAARGIANQVLNAVMRFVTDFMTALNPQITKEYASGNMDKSKELCLQGAKFSFFLMLFFAIPVIFRTHQILSLWLVEYPDYTVIFIRCSFVLALLTILSAPFITEFLATGNLTATTWWIGGTRLLSLPLIFICYKLGGTPEYAYYSLIVIEIISLYLRLFILERITNMDLVRDFTMRVLGRILVVSIFVIVFVYYIDRLFTSDIFGLLLFTMSSMLNIIFMVILLGFSGNERNLIINSLKRKLSHI